MTCNNGKCQYSPILKQQLIIENTRRNTIWAIMGRNRTTKTPTKR